MSFESQHRCNEIGGLLLIKLNFFLLFLHTSHKTIKCPNCDCHYHKNNSLQLKLHCLVAYVYLRPLLKCRYGKLTPNKSLNGMCNLI
jgi:hypothetical protein